MADNTSNNDDPPKTPCKYGSGCYQRNPQHHSKYSHPPGKLIKDNRNHKDTNPSKKRKIQDYFRVAPKPHKASDDVSIKISNEENEVKRCKREEPESSKHHLVTGNDDNSDKNEDTTSESSSMKKTNNETDKEQENLQMEDVTKPQNVPSPPTKMLDNISLSRDFNKKDFIKKKFLFHMPLDFYSFWEFCKTLKANCPEDAFKDIGLKLVGPYDVLAGKLNGKEHKTDDDYLLHWRYFYDVPGFQTVLKGDDTDGFHIGYLRDKPDELPKLLAWNYGTKDGILHVAGDNIFAAVNTYLGLLKKSGSPFRKMHVPKYESLIKKQAEQLILDISEDSEKIKERKKKIVTRTFNQIGLVVPYNRKTQTGYRSLMVSNKELKQMLDNLQKALPEQRAKYLSELQSVLTATSIALDEFDFGTGVELGWDILCHGIDSINATIERFLSSSYKLLKYDAFAKIAEAHMRNRKKGCNLSII